MRDCLSAEDAQRVKHCLWAEDVRAVVVVVAVAVVVVIAIVAVAVVAAAANAKQSEATVGLVIGSSPQDNFRMKSSCLLR